MFPSLVPLLTLFEVCTRGSYLRSLVRSALSCSPSLLLSSPSHTTRGRRHRAGTYTMKLPSAATTLILLATSTALSATIPAPPPSIDYTLFKRTLLASPTRLVNASYDYIIVGGGFSGLVLANRLSSNASISVAVIEAGSSGYSTDRKFLVPSANLYDSSVGTEYDWQFTTSP